MQSIVPPEYVEVLNPSKSALTRTLTQVSEHCWDGCLFGVDRGTRVLYVPPGNYCYGDANKFVCVPEATLGFPLQ